MLFYKKRGRDFSILTNLQNRLTKACPLAAHHSRKKTDPEDLSLQKRLLKKFLLLFPVGMQYIGRGNSLHDFPHTNP